MKDGFRERGAQVTRLEAFVDAAFAFALTLLVISASELPRSISELLVALKQAPAFALSFLQIAMFWHAHVRWTRRYGLDDTMSIWLSLGFVFVMLIFVHPLRIMFGTFCAWATGGWLPWPLETIQGYGDIVTMFIVYGLSFAASSLLIAAHYWHAWRQREALGLTVEECAITASEIAAWCWAALVGALSLLVALTMPASPPFWLSGMPGMVFFLMNLSWLVTRRVGNAVRTRMSGGV